MLELSKRFDEGQPVSISTISDSQGISESFLIQIMMDLKNADLVESTRGVNGGYQLSRPPSEISVAEVIQVIEGPMIDLKCMHPPGEEDCDLEPTCEVQSVWEVIKARIVSFLKEMTFDEVQRLSSTLSTKQNLGTDQPEKLETELKT